MDGKCGLELPLLMETQEADDDGGCSSGLAASAVSCLVTPRRSVTSPVTITVASPSLYKHSVESTQLVNMADAKYYELYRRSRYCMRSRRKSLGDLG